MASGAATTVGWSYTWVPATPGPIVVESRAADDSGNIERPSGGVTVNVSYQPTSTTGLVAGKPVIREAFLIPAPPAWPAREGSYAPAGYER